ncbi:MAG: F0F1 ATP synthase assembly protein I [Caulobacterales bacterium 32-69-10]|nr:MAG: F0F1 ATP synthase assembly protein I [Caulobacterales bacterium 32-69-10]
MAKPPEPREEALKRLNERAAALDARTQRPTTAHAGEQAVSQAYRIIAELLGGVLVGLAVGFVADRFLPTAPWGMIVGVLLGFALSIWMARRTANRLMAMAKKSGEPIQSVPFDDDEE